jgi:hypothetical protein
MTCAPVMPTVAADILPPFAVEIVAAAPTPEIVTTDHSIQFTAFS